MSPLSFGAHAGSPGNASPPQASFMHGEGRAWKSILTPAHGWATCPDGLGLLELSTGHQLVTEPCVSVYTWHRIDLLGLFSIAGFLEFEKQRDGDHSALACPASSRWQSVTAHHRGRPPSLPYKERVEDPS